MSCRGHKLDEVGTEHPTAATSAASHDSGVPHGRSAATQAITGASAHGRSAANEAVTGAAPPGVGAIVVAEFRLPSGQWFEAHRHPQHQLVWSPRGVLGVTVDDASWVLPPTRGLWLPGGVVHRTGATRDAGLRGLYFEPDRCPLTWSTPTPVAVDRLLAELFEYLARDDLDDGPRLRAEAVVFDLLRPLPSTPIEVPDPVDERVRAIADVLLANPADPRGLEAHARQIGVGRRTLTRLFVQDTGMSFDRWRTQLRMRTALPLLAEGQPVFRVAKAVGYATPSGFLAAFRRTVGVAPGQYLAGADPATEDGSADA